MDLLSEILHAVSLRGTVYFHASFQSPWGMDIPSGQYANYHIVTNGACWLEMHDPEERIQLNKGDVVLFPRGNAHTLVDNLQSDVVTADKLLSNARKNGVNDIVFGGDGFESAALICGHFEYDRECPHPLFETLPTLIYISAGENPEANWFATASELAAQISTGNNMGKDAVITRLAESLFIQILGNYFQQLDDPASFLAAMQDRHIGLALKAIHDDISYDWSLADLAKISLMSKSVFSSKFHRMVGEPPFVYVARWRMLKAREMLSNTSMPIRVISEKVGYKSEFSFSKAFKKLTGLTPGSLRKPSLR